MIPYPLQEIFGADGQPLQCLHLFIYFKENPAFLSRLFKEKISLIYTPITKSSKMNLLNNHLNRFDEWQWSFKSMYTCYPEIPVDILFICNASE